MVEIADERIHGTTHQRPSERFGKEKLRLIKRPEPYVYIPAIERKVSQDSMISFANNRYSVPWLYVGHCVDLKITNNLLFISTQGKVIGTHQVLQGKHQHFAGLLDCGHKKRANLPEHDPYWQTELEVENRDLAIYEKVCLSSPQSLLRH